MKTSSELLIEYQIEVIKYVITDLKSQGAFLDLVESFLNFLSSWDIPSQLKDGRIPPLKAQLTKFRERLNASDRGLQSDLNQFKNELSINIGSLADQVGFQSQYGS